ncbi:MAG: DUF3313 family protein [Steroidobacteraceae bacterium]
MKPRRKPRLTIVGIVSAAVALGGCTTTTTAPIEAAPTQDGLQRAEVKGIDAVYRKPDANLSRYTKLLVRRAEVQFAKDWNPGTESTPLTLSDADRDRIRGDLSAAFHDVLKRELQTEGGYVLVDSAGPDVLEVRPTIVDLAVKFSGDSKQTDVQATTYTLKAGEMTLVAELHDSVTGELLSRAYDKEESSGSWQWTPSMPRTTEARRIMEKWAKLLRHSLDASRNAAS